VFTWYVSTAAGNEARGECLSLAEALTLLNTAVGVPAPVPTFVCPRRLDQSVWALQVSGAFNVRRYADACIEAMSPPRDGEGAPLDFWRKDVECSYCGSLKPSRVIAAVRNGAELGPTDKAYKVYVEGGRDEHGVNGKFYPAHCTQAESDELRALIRSGDVAIGYPGHFYKGLYLHPVPEDEDPS